MNDILPSIRRDLEFIPFEYQGRPLILVRDHLGLVPEGKAIEFDLYRLMILLQDATTIRDIQTSLMRERGGILVGSEEVKALITHLDESYLLDSERFKKARDRIVREFAESKVRFCSHSGKAYPGDPRELRHRLDEIMSLPCSSPRPEGKVAALVSPHIDITVGAKGYASAYRCLHGSTPERVVVLGVAHQGFDGLFALTAKDFSTPLGRVKAETASVEKLKAAGKDVIAVDDFAHKAEHSIEFQVIFLQHLLGAKPFSMIPILCGSLLTSLPEYQRAAYLDKAGPFLEAMRDVVADQEILVVAGVDFSHIGPKFGHETPARHLESRSRAHDERLLHCLASRDADGFWDESSKVRDQYNVCGFAALACLLEVLPPCRGEVLHYEIWHEEATRSAVSFAAVFFAEQKKTINTNSGR